MSLIPTSCSDQENRQHNFLNGQNLPVRASLERTRVWKEQREERTAAVVLCAGEYAKTQKFDYANEDIVSSCTPLHQCKFVFHAGDIRCSRPLFQTGVWVSGADCL